MKYILIVALLLPLVANAKPIEIWKCTDMYTSSKKTLVKATVDKGREWGEIHVSGAKHTAKFSVAGFNRRWDFGTLTERHTYPYAFTINPRGEGKYFDFTLEAKTTSSMSFECNQIK